MAAEIVDECLPLAVLFQLGDTSLGEERANLSAFRTFVWFVIV